jgi:ferrous iron transport protein B
MGAVENVAPQAPVTSRTPMVALLGNPNCGKTACSTA